MGPPLQSPSRHQRLRQLTWHYLKPVLLHMNHQEATPQTHFNLHQGSPLSHYQKMSPQLKLRQEEVPPQPELPPGTPGSLYPEVALAVALPVAPTPATSKSGRHATTVGIHTFERGFPHGRLRVIAVCGERHRSNKALSSYAGDPASCFALMTYLEGAKRRARLEQYERFNREINGCFSKPRPSMTTNVSVIKTLSAEYVRRLADVPSGRAHRPPRERIRLPPPIEIPPDIQGDDEHVADEHPAEESSDGEDDTVGVLLVNLQISIYVFALARLLSGNDAIRLAEKPIVALIVLCLPRHRSQYGVLVLPIRNTFCGWI
ncbi:Urease accessory protein UreG [Phytophthora cinnamomi]|uniref:Urease accessory protein UreG n=1 Tax=Phytophthora cinnamomi TaxID=4785 RepID=UPI0035593F47|nr:Urease accessory protein UreG [Phytophthora cinnamomi]